MKLIDIMKQYNKCILKENAKLRSIYNTLIRECDNNTDTNECDDIEETEETLPTKSNNIGKTMSMAEFLGECDKEVTENDDLSEEDLEASNESEEISEEEVIDEEEMMTAE
jgi:hypothetical protein